MKKVPLAVLSVLLFLSTFAVFFTHRPQAGAASSTPKVAYERWIDAHTFDVYVQSSLTDSWLKEVRVIVPDGWSKDTAHTWPTLWLLHGGGDNYASWTQKTDVEQLVAAHNIMVVMPNTSWCSSYSDWWNYGKYGSPAWESYITSDLRGLMQNQYHADGNNATIAGLSMGGLGALKLAMNHTDMFRGVASFSGNADPLHAFNNTSDFADPPTLGCLLTIDWKKVWGDYNLPEQRAIWERNDPYVQSAKFAQMKYVFLSSGDGLSDPAAGKSTADNPLEKQVNVETHALVSHLQEQNIPAESDFYAGVHDWPYWQQELHKALPGLLRAMNTQ